jgi:phosphatidylglycerol---prolipoprotein diacylglyceryl transferase
MITIGIDPVIFSIGHFMIRWYGVIVTIAIGAGLWIAWREAKRKGLDEKHFNDVIIWVIIAGMIGARLFHVIDHWPHEYANDPIRALYIWEGGLAIWGGVIGGGVALAIFARRRHLRLSFLFDLAAPAVVLGQAIGRFACIITGDAMGKPTTGPFGFAYTSPDAMVPQLGVYYTPTPVYEIIMNFIIFGLVWRLRKKNLPDGVLFLIYLTLYSAGRFVITFWSSYEIVALGLNQAQLISLVALIVGVPLLVRLLLQNRKAQPALS